MGEVIPRNEYLVDRIPNEEAMDEEEEESEQFIPNLVSYTDKDDAKLLDKISKMKFGVDADRSQEEEARKMTALNEDLFVNDIILNDLQSDDLDLFDNIERKIQNSDFVDDLNELDMNQTALDTDDILKNISIEEEDHEIEPEIKQSITPVYIQKEHEGAHQRTLQETDEVLSLIQNDFEAREMEKTNWVYMFNLPYFIQGKG